MAAIGARGGGLVGAAILVALLSGLRLETRGALFFSRNGVTVERLGGRTLPSGDKIGGRVDDLLLAAESMQLVIGGSTATAERRQMYGAILDATSATWHEDALHRAAVVATLGARPLKLTTDDIDLTILQGVPALRIVQNSFRPRLTLSTTVRVQPGVDHAEIVTSVRNDGMAVVEELRVGDEVAWPGVPTFAPGLGEVTFDSSVESLPWFGRRGRGLAYAWVFVENPGRVEFSASGRDADQIGWSKPIRLEPGEEAVHRRAFVATWQGMARAAEAAWTLSGVALGRVVGQLSPVPSRAMLTAIGADGSTVLKALAGSDGSFDLALPSGRYTLSVRSPGGIVSQLVDVDPALPPVRADLDLPKAEQLSFSVSASNGRPLPARLTVRGLAGTPDPVFGPSYRARGANNEIFSIQGTGTVEIPAGRYSVVVTRGFEYSAVEKIVNIFPGEGAVLSVVLLHEVETPGWISADFHLHASPSRDSEVSLVDRITSLVSAGIEFAAATDHNHVTSYQRAIVDLEARNAIGSTVGVEVTTEQWGHFNAFPLRRRGGIPPYAEATPETIFGHLRARPSNPVIQVNHPWMAGYGYFHLAALDVATGKPWRPGFSFDFDTIEVINGFELADPGALDMNLERWFSLLNLGHRFFAVGNSDSHRMSPEWAGYPRNYVMVGRDEPGAVTPLDVSSALRAGRIVVSNGPFIEASLDGVGPGGQLELAGDTAELSIVVRAADWVDVRRADVIVNGEMVDVIPANAPPEGDVRLRRTVELFFDRDSWVVVVVRGERPLDPVLPGLSAPPFGFTNPVFVTFAKSAAAAPGGRPRDASLPMDASSRRVPIREGGAEGGVPGGG